MSKLSDAELNEAIAKACGWKLGKEQFRTSRGTTTRTCWLNPVGGIPCQNVPDFCNDLNACHEAEKVLTTGKQWEDYTVALCHLHIDKRTLGDIHLIHATARQRAEALHEVLKGGK